MAAFESGLENQVSYLLPPEGGLSEEEAVAMAWEGIIERYRAGLLPCDISMLDECTAKAMYVRHDPSPLWMISFFHDDYPRVPVFTAEILNETYVQVSCEDVNSMYNIYAQWRAERNQRAGMDVSTFEGIGSLSKEKKNAALTKSLSEVWAGELGPATGNIFEKLIGPFYTRSMNRTRTRVI